MQQQQQEDAIAQILEVLPEYGRGFLAACLHSTANDPQTVIHQLLEGSLPKHLGKLDPHLTRWQPPSQPHQQQKKQQPQQQQQPATSTCCLAACDLRLERKSPTAVAYNECSLQSIYYKLLAQHECAGIDLMDQAACNASRCSLTAACFQPNLAGMQGIPRWHPGIIMSTHLLDAGMSWNSVLDNSMPTAQPSSSAPAPSQAPPKPTAHKV